MNRLFKFSGILLWISAAIFGIYYLYNNFTEVSDTIFKWIGIISLILLTGFVFIRLTFGKKWFIETPKSFLIGTDLIKATENTLNELPQPTKATLANLIGHLIYRFTRLGLIGIAIASIPIILLWQQNRLINQQNTRLDQQTALLEADRRSSIILESGNVLDAVSRELEFNRPKGDSTLSPTLIGRIIALSRGLKPYKYLDPDADTFIEKALSPERGHLIVALYNSRLDSITYNMINRGADFSNTDLKGAFLPGVNFQFANLKGSNLEGAYLHKAHLLYTNLNGANLKLASFSEANFHSIELIFGRMGGSEWEFFYTKALPEFYTDEPNAFFSMVNLNNKNIAISMLPSVDLRFANLEGVNFESTDLSRTMLFESQLNNANFTGSKVSTLHQDMFQGKNIDTGKIVWVRFNKPLIKSVNKGSIINADSFKYLNNKSANQP